MDPAFQEAFNLECVDHTACRPSARDTIHGDARAILSSGHNAIVARFDHTSIRVVESHIRAKEAIGSRLLIIQCTRAKRSPVAYPEMSI